MVRLLSSSLSPSPDLSVGYLSMCLFQIERYSPLIYYLDVSKDPNTTFSAIVSADGNESLPHSAVTLEID
jgi:hypothetical protein